MRIDLGTNICSSYKYGLNLENWTSNRCGTDVSVYYYLINKNYFLCCKYGLIQYKLLFLEYNCELLNKNIFLSDKIIGISKL